MPGLALLQDCISGRAPGNTWQLHESPPNAWADANACDSATQIPGNKWIPAQIPGTVAQALERAGCYSVQSPRPLHDSDFWYRGTLFGNGEYVLEFEGLATLVEIYQDGQRLATSTSMFVPLRLNIKLRGSSVFHLAFRSLHTHLDSIKPPRARWRVAMIPRQALRGVRTTLLGHMPSWCPEIHTVGPWQAMRLIPMGAIEDIRLHASLDGDTGILNVAIRCRADLSGAQLSCSDVSARLTASEDHWYRATLRIDQISPWWPNGMGEQALHAVTLQIQTGMLNLGQVGFRRIELDKGIDGQGFALKVNGRPFFARGVVHTPVDPLHPGGEEGIPERLRLLADMGANMIRIAGPFCYESTEFFRQCDALGLLVWQDLMLANFDYPLTDPAFAKQIENEIEALLHRLSGSPSLALICGGSEVLQQAAMLGLPAERQPLGFYCKQLQEICQRLAPELIVVPNSPSGGSLPFNLREGVSHYYGVGAYERPLEDARRAAPRFVSECLAFANVPEPLSLEAMDVPAVHHPDWKVGVPRDRGASWDFEDTRDHYLERIFGLDPAKLRRADPARYLDASRALAAHIMSVTLAEWRRPASPTRGAFVFTAGDLRPGAGWGLIDFSGEPKAPYYGFRQACQPLALLVSDEGCNGLDIHLINDTPNHYHLHLEVCALRDGKTPVAHGEIEIEIPAGSGTTLEATRVLGNFFDLTYAFRFGPAGHDTVVVTARQVDAASTPVFLQACHFPLGPYAPQEEIALQATALCEDGLWWLELSTASVARFVHIDDRNFRPQENYFHLVPGCTRRIRLLPRTPEASSPEGSVGALNARQRVGYRGNN